MVCYARPASRIALIALVALVVFGWPVDHFLNTAALLVAVTSVTAGAAVAAALVFATLMSTRRRRAVAGGCVSCPFQCQHAMTAAPSRLWLVSSVDRSTSAVPVTAGARPGPAGARLLPIRSVQAAGGGLRSGPGERAQDPAGPAWPHRPVHRAEAPAR